MGEELHQQEVDLVAVGVAAFRLAM